MKKFVWCIVLIGFSVGSMLLAEEVTLPLLRDTYISQFPTGARSLSVKNSEQGANAGVTNRLKIKKNENLVLLNFDFNAIAKDKSIKEGVITLTVLDEKKMLRFVGVSTLHVDWEEGKGQWDDDGKVDTSHKGACFLGPKGVDSLWLEGEPSDFSDVCYGNGGGVYESILAEPKGAGKFEIKIPGYMMEIARKNGQTFVLSDDTAVFNGDMDNVFIASKEAESGAPTLKIALVENKDEIKPEFIDLMKVEGGPFPGSLIVYLPQFGDDNKDGLALYYEVDVNGKKLPWYLVPNPRRQFRKILLENFIPAATVEIVVKAYDEAGNFHTMKTFGKASEKMDYQLSAVEKSPESSAKAMAANDQLEVKLVNGLTLYDPVTGKAFAHQERKAPNDAQNLFSVARGEILGMQVLMTLKGADGVNDIELTASELKGANGSIASKNVELFKEHYVLTNEQWIADILPDYKAGDKLAIPSQKEITGQKTLGVYVDIIVPKETAAGVYRGQIKINTSAGPLDLEYDLWVRDVVMPDELSFIVEMNAYGHSGKVEEFHETFRLLHKHRLSYNALGYGQLRTTNHTTPKLSEGKGKDVKITDWTEYDRFYGPLFSGEIAADLPRKNQPASHWYLPLYESWPVHLNENHPKLWEGRVKPKDDKQKYNEWVNHLAKNDLSLEDHFTPTWRETSAAVATQFKEHFKEKGWNKTQFQLFANNKYYFDTGSATLWTMDEPQYSRDYLALDFVYAFFRKYLEDKDLNIINRADISRPQFVGGRMDAGLDFMVVSSALNLYVKLIRDHRIMNLKELWWYGGGISAEGDPLHYAALFFDKWKRVCDGGMPQYTTFAGSNDWATTGNLRVVRFDMSTKMPVCTFRMKAYRYGQQYVEFLNLLAKTKGWSIWQLRKVLDEKYPTKSTTKSLNPDDPGTSVFDDLNYEKFEGIKEQLISTILSK